MDKKLYKNLQENLDEAAKRYADETYDDSSFRLEAIDNFKAGAHWKNGHMTESDKVKLRNMLIDRKCIASDQWKSEDPFVGIYINDLVEIIEKL